MMRNERWDFYGCWGISRDGIIPRLCATSLALCSGLLTPAASSVWFVGPWDPSVSRWPNPQVWFRCCKTMLWNCRAGFFPCAGVAEGTACIHRSLGLGAIQRRMSDWPSHTNQDGGNRGVGSGRCAASLTYVVDGAVTLSSILEMNLLSPHSQFLSEI